MGKPAGVYRVTFGGALNGGEVWECGFWVNGAAPTTNALAVETAQLWWAQLTATDGSGGAKITLSTLCVSTTTMTYCTVQSYPTGGTVATATGTYTGTPITGAATSLHPNQIAVVASLRTNTAGRQNRGRMYLPATGVALGATGQLQSSQCSGVATGWATCFNDWNASGDNGVVSVLSQVGSGHVTAVTAVIVDSVADTQRRRRNKLAPAFVSSVVVTP